MNENVSTAAKYAIRLPNGKLCNDLPGDVRAGFPTSEILPNGDHVYVWREDDLHNVRNTLRNIAQVVNPWGAQELFQQHARIVTVRFTAEILDGVFDNDEVPDAEMAADEPRTWATAEEVPADVTVRAKVSHSDFTFMRAVPNRFDSFKDGVYVDMPYESSLTAAYPDGFVEVLP
jgi:hypothetical protein